MGIVHMNGRIYDAKLGRFLQADPVVQAPKNSQNLNRYSYVLNNPLSYTDPSGYFSFKSFARLVVAAVATYYTFGWASGLAWASTAAGNAAIAGAISGAVGGGILTGTVKGAFYGALSGAALGAIGASGLNNFAKGVTAGSANGVISELQGGKFGHGFLSAGAGFWTGLNLGGDISFGKFLGASIAGGTISELTGGKFANGAISAGLAYAVAAIGGGQSGRKPTHQEVTYGKLANGVYDSGFQGADGYRKVGDTFFDEETGLQSALFVNEATGHSVFAFAGSNGGGDWAANIRQAFGLKSAQYNQALGQAQTVYASTGGNVHFVGHSLGGGLATASAIMTGGSATVFNAAGVHPSTVGGLTPAPGSITHFRSSFDALQLVNALTPGRVYGEQVSLGTAGWHTMGGVCRAIGC